MNAREELNKVKIALNVSTDQELADILKTNKRNIENWVGRNTIPDKWQMIMSGLISPNARLPTENPKQLERILSDIKEKEGVHLHFYPGVDASAGYGSSNDVLAYETVTISRFFVESMRISNINRLDILRIFGDSMEPDFYNGEYVVVERVDTIEEVKTGNTVIANIEGEIYIKKIEKIPFERTVILHSTNQIYTPIRITDSQLDDLHIIGIVRGVIGLR